jgi:NDP-sugar pyrophosphorylase family protein
VEYGDTYLRAPLAEVGAAFEASGMPALMTVYRNENRLERSNVHFEAGTLLAYDKHAPSAAMRHIDFGLLAFTSDALRRIPPTGPHDLAELLRALLGRGELAGFEVPERFYEIGTPDALAETERLLHPLLSVTHAARG